MENSDWDTEYYLRRYLNFSTADLERMPVKKINYFVKLLEKEFKELEKQLKG